MVGVTALSAPKITYPVIRSVTQMNFSTSKGSVLIQGVSKSPWLKVQAMATATGGGQSVGWTDIQTTNNQNGNFSGHLNLSKGQYTISVRTARGTIHSTAAQAQLVGVGVVMIVAGQSLAGNWGGTANNVTNPHVYASNLSGVWQTANDPQPVADSGNGGGSMIPILGSLLANYLSCPFGSIDVAVGGTSVQQWLTTYYVSRLQPALRLFKSTWGASCVAWQQGEQDGGIGTSASDYETRTQLLISNSRADWGSTIPWGIADRSTYELGAASPTIQGAQDWLVANTPIVFAGANTDTLTGTTYRLSDNTHLTQAGQTQQATMWFNAFKTYFGI